LNPPKSDLNRFAAAMKEPFQELTFLDLRTTRRKTALVLPDSFLGGSAPRLQTLWFYGISFPAMPKLLSSATDLVTLRLLDVPYSGYISPKAMVAGLSALTRLESLSVGFQSPRSRPDQPSPPQSTRAVLPALKYFEFRGACQRVLGRRTSLLGSTHRYSEIFVSRSSINSYSTLHGSVRSSVMQRGSGHTAKAAKRVWHFTMTLSNSPT
jgi:hypothetical protein